ncbi:MAG: DUF6516 family protein [bacterium]
MDSSFLDMREYVNCSGVSVTKYTYSYHYQKSNKIIFRYDNTPHHRRISTFPRHKHLASGEIVESTDISLKDVLEEISRML